MSARLALLVAVALGAGCLAINPPDGAYRCASAAPRCPDGQLCDVDGICKKMLTAGKAPSQAFSTLTVSPAPPASVPADGTSAVTVTVTLRADDDTPIAGAAVAFSATGGVQLPDSATTGSDGTAVVMATATLPGDDVITALSGELTLTAHALFASQTPSPIALRFTVPPTATLVGATIAPAVQIDRVDGNQHVVPGVASFTIAIGTNPAGGTLSGTTTLSTSSGSALFTDLSLDKAGVGYTLTVTSGTLNVTSGLFDVTTTPPVQELCVANNSNSAITSYTLTANGNATPLRTLAGGTTTLSTPVGITGDRTHDELVIPNYNNNTVTVFARTANGDVAPKRTITSVAVHPNDVDVDLTNDELAVASYGPAVIAVYDRLANGNATAKRTITGAATGLSGAQCVRVDSVNNEIWVANYSNSSLTVHSRTATGNVAPLRTVTGAATTLNAPDGLAVDVTNNEVYVANQGSNSVVVFDRTATGNAAPKRTLSGASTGLAQPSGIALNLSTGELFVANYNGGAGAASITVYPRLANGNVAPSRTISGAATGLNGATGITVCK